MSQNQVSQFIEQATREVQQGRNADSLETLKRALALDPKNSEALELKGIACSSLGLYDEATDAFRAATVLSPSSPKLLFNYAVHLNGIGSKELALQAARTSAILDPTRSGAVELLRALEKETGANPTILPDPLLNAPPAEGENDTPPSQVAYAPYLRPGYYGDGEEIQSLRFVERMGKAWYAIGWTLCGLDGMFCVYAIVLAVRLFSHGAIFIDQGNPIKSMGMGSAGIYIGALGDLGVLALLVWFILELTNRRGNWLWLIPSVLACCLLRTSWIVIGLYIIFERSRRPRPA